ASIKTACVIPKTAHLAMAPKALVIPANVPIPASSLFPLFPVQQPVFVFPKKVLVLPLVPLPVLANHPRAAADHQNLPVVARPLLLALQVAPLDLFNLLTIV